MFDEPIPWMSSAACAEVGGSIFFPEHGESAHPARTICKRCPVITECLQYAQDEMIPHGIFAGKTAQQRRYLRRTKKVA